MTVRIEAAREFAARYVELVDALKKQGLPDAVAREEARMAATLIFLVPEHVAKGEPCPVCGKRGSA